MENPKSKSAKSKKHKSKIKGKKKETKRKDKNRKKWEKHGLVHLHLCCFFLLFRFAFCLLLFCFFLLFSRHKQKKSKPKATKKANRKSKKKQQKCKWTSQFFFPIFHPFWRSFFFPFILLPVFFGFEVVLFDFPCIFLLFAFFSSLKNIRISYRGGHNCSVVGWLNISNS